jgi:cystathionine beta-lyase/cystathionine gamma-synthase
MPGRPINPPVVLSSTFAFDDTQGSLAAVAGDGHLYSRWSNPTVEAVEERIVALTGAERTLAFGSGMAAISNALLCALRETPRLLCHQDVYGGTYELVRDVLPGLGIEVTFFSTDRWEEAFHGTWGAVYAETPTNPTLRVLDLEKMSAAAHSVGARFLVDNTFATPLVQRPLELGADVEIHSATKALGGHHDLLAGVVAADHAFCESLWTYRKLFGAVLDPHAAYLLHRGLKTLEVRVTRQCETAATLARWLEVHPKVQRVFYPGLESHPDHDVAAKQLEAGGTMVGFVVEGGYGPAVAAVDALSTFLRAPSLGGTESLATLPKTTSHCGLSDAELEAAGVDPGFVRLSVGLEPVEALQADLDQAL